MAMMAGVLLSGGPANSRFCPGIPVSQTSELQSLLRSLLDLFSSPLPLREFYSSLCTEFQERIAFAPACLCISSSYYPVSTWLAEAFQFICTSQDLACVCWMKKWMNESISQSQLTFGLLLLFSCSVMSDSLWPRGRQHIRSSCPSPSPRACSNSCPLNWWCHPTIWTSVVPFSSCLHFFWASETFPMNWLIRWPKYWSFSISSSNEYSGLIFFRINWFDLLEEFLGFSRVFSNTTVQKCQKH